MSVQRADYEQKGYVIGSPLYDAQRVSGYGEQSGQTEQPNYYNPVYTPPPTPRVAKPYCATQLPQMAVQYQDSSGKTLYLGDPKAQAYYNPQILASTQAQRNPKNVIITGPAPAGRPPMDYYKTSIFLTFVCFFPLGIICWLKSKRCREAIKRGDYDRANEISKELKIYTEVTLGLGWFTYVLGLVITIVFLAEYYGIKG